MVLERARELGRVIDLMFKKICLKQHPDKSFFERTPRPGILGILGDTENQPFILSQKNLAANEKSGARLLRYASQHRRIV